MANNKNHQQTLADAFLMKLEALYDIENEIIKALPKLSKKATNGQLKQAFTEHLAETKEHAKRLEQIFKMLGQKAKKLKVDAIRGLAKDADWVAKTIKTKETLDANLIAAAQYVEHYEIAGYGSAREWADELGYAEAVALLDKTLGEERNADKKLSMLATSTVNAKAMAML